MQPVNDATTSRPPRRWPLFLAGTLLFVLGPAIYFVQLKLGYLGLAWYTPALATLGVVLLALSAWKYRGSLRLIGLVLFAVLCGFEWYMTFIGSKTPPYTGPAQPGRKIPEFSAALADGTPFTNQDLESGTPVVLVFFRGRW